MTLDPDILADLAVEITPKAYVRVTPMAHAATPLGAGFGVTRFASPTKAFKVIYLGQDLICQIIHLYPQIAHLVPRDLLWFFGGDCLHFMPDEELDLYQALEERRFEAEQNDEPFDWNQEKQLLAMPQDQRGPSRSARWGR